MARTEQREGASGLANSSRNKRQASMFLAEVARTHCKSAVENIETGTRLMEESKRIAEKSKKLRAPYPARSTAPSSTKR